MLTLLVTLLAACAGQAPPPASPSQGWAGDDYFERGAYARAAAAYEGELRTRNGGPDRAGALHRLALSYLAEEGPAARRRARAVLIEIIDSYPRSTAARTARILVDRIGEIDHARDRLRLERDRLHALEATVENLRKLVGELAERSLASDAAVEETRKERERLAREVKALEATVAEQRTQIDKLNEQLDGLKNIDLERRP